MLSETVPTGRPVATVAEGENGERQRRQGGGGPAGPLAPDNDPLTDAQKVLIEEHLPYVADLALEIGSEWNVEADEAFSIGSEVLIRFIQSITDPKRLGTTINTFARKRLVREFSRRHHKLRTERKRTERLPSEEKMPVYEECFGMEPEVGVAVAEHIVRSLPDLLKQDDQRIVGRVMDGKKLKSSDKSRWYRHIKPKLRAWATQEGLVGVD
jgi:hypothetical protein